MRDAAAQFYSHSMPVKSVLQTQAQYALHRGVSRQYIGNLAKRGILVMRGRLVDVQASDGVLDDKPETATVVTQQPNSYGQARLAREVFAAKLKKLEYEMKSGKLIDADDVSRKWSAIGRQLRDRFLGLPTKLAPQLAAATDVQRVREMLDTEVTAILKELSDDIRYGRT